MNITSVRDLVFVLLLLFFFLSPARVSCWVHLRVHFFHLRLSLCFPSCHVVACFGMFLCGAILAAERRPALLEPVYVV